VKFTPPKTAGVCDTCGTALITRADDKPEAIAQRLREYHDKTAPLADYYRKGGVLKSIDGVGELDLVLDRIVRALGD
jgi:adenylate kinase